MSEELDVYVAHDPADTEAARDLCAALAARGCRVAAGALLDPGDFSDSLGDDQRRSRLTAVLVGGGPRDHYTLESVAQAIDQIAEGRHAVVPVLLPDADARPPYGLRRFHPLRIGSGGLGAAADVLAERLNIRPPPEAPRVDERGSTAERRAGWSRPLALALLVAGVGAGLWIYGRAPAPPDALRLVCLDGRPVVRGVPADAAFTDGSWLYARSPAGLRVAVLAVREADARRGFLKVYGLYSEGGPLVIPAGGLAVEPVPPGSTARVGKGLANALRGDGAAYDRAVSGGEAPRLTLDVGAAHGVEAGDVYRVLGAPIVEGRAVKGFERKASCRVVAGHVAAESAGCALDRGASPGYGREDWIAGGRVRLAVDPTAELRCGSASE